MSHDPSPDPSPRDLPRVSICTPTRDRPAFLSLLLRCLLAQDYPAGLLEWVVVDDGAEPVEDLCRAFPALRYVRLEPGAPLGLKRNLSHKAATGEILLCMDDDDYQPPWRVSRTVAALQDAPWALAAGSSEYPLYFGDRDQVWILGPYGPFHATAGTLALRRELLATTSYLDAARCSEERAFLRNYSVPMVQVPPSDTLLAMAHGGNTYDKRQILLSPAVYEARRSSWRLEDLIPQADLREGYLQALGG